MQHEVKTAVNFIVFLVVDNQFGFQVALLVACTAVVLELHAICGRKLKFNL